MELFKHVEKQHYNNKGEVQYRIYKEEEFISEELLTNKQIDGSKIGRR